MSHYKLGFVMLTLCGPLVVPSFGQTGDGRAKEPTQPDVDAAIKLVVERTNKFRTDEGRKAVKTNDKLTDTAKDFAAFMARTTEYGHEADSKKPSDRVKDHGYEYCLVAENIAYVFDPAGFPTGKLADEFVTGWKNSPGHRKNMLDPDMTETGVAIARSEKNGYYYAVQLFGRPKTDAIEFRVTNNADAVIEYTIGENKFMVQPRFAQVHTLCRPDGVTFKWPGSDENDKGTSITPANGEKFAVMKSNGGWKVSKE